jgi:hypothetical protein
MRDDSYLSDLSGERMSSAERHRAVMSFPDREDDLAIDLTAVEAEALTKLAIGVVGVRLMHLGEDPVELQFDVTGLRKGLGLKNEAALAELLEKAEPVAVVAAGGVRRAREESVSFATAGKFGTRHRGLTTDAEKAMVQADFEGAQANRAALGQPPIDLANPKDVERYSLHDLARERGFLKDEEPNGEVAGDQQPQLSPVGQEGDQGKATPPAE